jgi:N-acetylmuramoyl-L-alanine amidase
VLAVVTIAACGGRASPSIINKAAPSSEDTDQGQARAIAEGQAALPDRTEALAIAEAIEGRAEREGAGARAVALHATAARLLERLWRVEGHDQDASKAIALYRAAARDLGAVGACNAALVGARLVGDVSRDGAVTYAELYRLLRRLALAQEVDDRASSPCTRAIEEAIDALAAFRPSRGSLEAIDDELAKRGPVDHSGDSLFSEPRAPKVTRVESWPGHEAARIVLVLDRAAGYRVGDEVPVGATDPRTFLDLDGVELGSVPSEIASEGIVTRIVAERTSTGSRISLDLDGHAWRRVFDMHEPYRIVVDVARSPPGARGGGPRTVSRLVLDPGHGGSDTGARGPSGLEEKDVALDIARRTAPVLAAQGIQVVLTRDDDHFVSLEERTARANAFGADLFVSVHCNASEGRGRRGIEMYVLDTSRDEIALRVAARENETTQAAGGEVASILGGMRMADAAPRSKRLAELLLRASTTAVRMKYGDAVSGGVHAAGFYVLVGARMPAVLFETSYISNALEDQRLGDPDYRQLLGDAIANAVRAYREGR